jgi:hypothetical protein
LVVVEKFEMIHLETGDGDSLTNGKRANGVDWRALWVGQSAFL